MVRQLVSGAYVGLEQPIEIHTDGARARQRVAYWDGLDVFYLDARGQEELLERMEARTAARRAETELYRARPELVDPELRFTPKINKPYCPPLHSPSPSAVNTRRRLASPQPATRGRSPSPELFPARSPVRPRSRRTGQSRQRRGALSPERDTGERHTATRQRACLLLMRIPIPPTLSSLFIDAQTRN